VYEPEACSLSALQASKRVISSQAFEEGTTNNRSTNITINQGNIMYSFSKARKF
jgi:hypothetical protein